MLLTRNVILALEAERACSMDFGGKLGGGLLKNAIGSCWRFYFEDGSALPYGLDARNALVEGAYSRGKMLSAYELERKKIFKGIDVSCLKDEGVLFFDIETGGIGGGKMGLSKSSCIFLIGASWLVMGMPRFAFYLARDYCEESSVLLEFSELLKTKDMLCSFNGRSFDLPRIMARAELHKVGVGVVPKERHVDLYKIAEQAYRKRLPRRNQQSLEAVLFSFRREQDIHREEIPRNYRRFVRTQNPEEIEGILRHNLMDMLGLVALYKHFFYREPER